MEHCGFCVNVDRRCAFYLARVYLCTRSRRRR